MNSASVGRSLQSFSLLSFFITCFSLLGSILVFLLGPTWLNHVRKLRSQIPMREKAAWRERKRRKALATRVVVEIISFRNGNALILVLLSHREQATDPFSIYIYIYIYIGVGTLFFFLCIDDQINLPVLLLVHALMFSACIRSEGVEWSIHSSVLRSLIESTAQNISVRITNHSNCL